ncbi:hypothetical protein [Sphingomonas sp. PAMC 26621]|nr:hypothetical protein [Sphingomonas sp. PAMC 26621]
MTKRDTSLINIALQVLAEAVARHPANPITAPPVRMALRVL